MPKKQLNVAFTNLQRGQIDRFAGKLEKSAAEFVREAVEREIERMKRLEQESQKEKAAANDCLN